MYMYIFVCGVMISECIYISIYINGYACVICVDVWEYVCMYNVCLSVCMKTCIYM